MLQRTFWTVGIVLVLTGAVSAQTRQAQMNGRGGDGKCTIEIEVDDAAEVEIFGDSARLRTLSGGPANWRRFECNQPLPRNPNDFRFRGIDGRGNQQLVRDPRNSGGRAVVLIEDRKSGREGYTFDIEWRGGSSYGGGYNDGRYGDGRYGDGRYGNGRYDNGRYGNGGFQDASLAARNCQDAAANQLQRDGYGSIRFGRVAPDDNPGRGNDWILGAVSARRGNYNDQLTFSCRVDLNSGRVRSVTFNRR